MSFKVYRSSAGSGKTYTLVRSYLRLALSGAPEAFRNILAITFTNKAANEMKERILSALHAFSSGTDQRGSASMAKELCEELGIDQKMLIQRSSKLRAAILHNYADFSVSTIDKFTHRIVRTFAHDLRLNVGFEVELDEPSLLQKAIEELVSKAGLDDEVTSLLVDFTKSKIAEEKSWQVERDLADFSSVLIRENSAFPSSVNKLSALRLKEIGIKVRERINEFQRSIKEIGSRALATLDQNGIEHSSLAGGKNGVAKYFTYLATHRMDKLIPSSTVVSNVKTGKWWSTKASQQEQRKIADIAGGLEGDFWEAQKIIEAKAGEIRMLMILEKSMYSLALLRSVHTELEKVKEEMNLVPISDFNKRIAGIVSKEPIPFIYERIGERYHHYLIDEFQDTSLLQWQNLLPLVENALSNGYHAMLVGDAKQSIYRWRGGDVTQFIQLPAIHAPLNPEFAAYQERSLSDHFELASLRQNFRSKQEIVQFNNDFFEFIVSELEDQNQLVYEDIRQEYDAKNVGGGVSIEQVPSGLDDVEERMCSSLVGVIKKALEEGYEFGSIAVIAKKNAEGSLIAQHLIEHNIPVVSSESLLLANSTRVQVLMQLLELLGDPRREATAIKIIEQLIQLGELEGNYIDLSLHYKDGGQNIFDFLSTHGIDLNAQEAGVLPIFEVVEMLCRNLGWMENSNPYLLGLLDVVYGYQQKEGSGRVGFLNWWKEKKGGFSVQVPEGTNAVEIMTIHKSKGLEFPVVIHPFATYTARSQATSAWVSLDEEEIEHLDHSLLPINRQLEQTRLEGLYQEEKQKALLDMLNMVYVAFTRAEERLYVITSIPSSQPNFRSLPNLLAEFCKRHPEAEEAPGHYLFGSMKKRPVSSNSSSTATGIVLDQIESSYWMDKVTITRRSQQLWETGDEITAQGYGNILHDAMAKVYTLKDISIQMNSLANAGWIKRDEARELTEKIEQILGNDQVATYFEAGGEVLNETAILGGEDQIYRPDRVVLKDDKLVVMDYKTGRKKKDHEDQLRRYAEVLTEMGYPQVEAFLIYLGGEGTVLKVAS